MPIVNLSQILTFAAEKEASDIHFQVGELRDHLTMDTCMKAAEQAEQIERSMTIEE